MSTTPYMNVTLPVPSVTNGPEWATEVNTAVNTIDAHDHSAGKGVKVPSAGLNINANVNFQSNAATSVKSVNLDSQSAALSTANQQAVYAITGDLWYNNSSGVPVQITQGTSIASASSPLVPAGVIWPYGGTSAPTGFLMCDGTAVSRTTYSGLFAIIGTVYGAGNGTTTFNLPNSIGRTPIGSGTYTDTVSGSVTRTLGASIGAEKHILVTAELAAHNHGGGNHSHTMFADSNSNPGALSSASQYVARAQSIGGSIVDYILQGLSSPVASVGKTADSGTVVASNGSDTAHNNMQPSFVTNYIIKT